MIANTRPLGLIILCSILALSIGCGTLGEGAAPNSTNGNILKATANERIYRADYDRTFRAAVDTLRQLDDGSAKLVRYNEGVIVFQQPNNSGVINANVSKVDAESTRVQLSATKTRKYWFDASNDEIRDTFFEKLDKTLGETPNPVENKKSGETPKETVVSQKSEETPPVKKEAEQKDAVVARLTDALQLEKNGQFLQKLSYDELSTLEQKVAALPKTIEKDKELTGKCAACYIDLARVYHDSGQYARAAEALKTAVAVEPNNAVAHCNLGEIYKHLSLFDDAIRELNVAKKLNPQLPDVYINLGIIYDDYVVDDQKALEYYRRYLALGGTDQQVVDWIKAIETNP